MHPDGHVYGRYGGRDAKGADTRNTLAGLRYAMEAAVASHRAYVSPAAAAAGKPLYIERVPAARGANGCIHCHQAKEILRQQDVNTRGTWDRESRWVYPLPENLGITLDLDRGNLVKAVAPGSAAAHAGIRPGDALARLHHLPVHSFADAQYALHKAPAKGTIAVAWQRGAQEHAAELIVAAGWKKTNILWRPSLMDLLPSLPLFGTDLTTPQKQELRLAAKRLAFRQDAPVPVSAEKLGVRENDVIIGVDDLVLEMTVEQFLGYVRQSYLIGDRITLNVVRAGKRVDLPITLK
jgi:membrane-associated protease RseP (regulator of RpoE activity)